MGITSTNDFGRFQTNKGEGEHVLNQLDRDPSQGGEPDEGFGIPGGLPKDHQEREEERLALIPEGGGGEYADGIGPNYLVVRDPQDDAPDNLDEHGSMNPPRHDRYADENSPYPTPDRVVPSTPTNANPSFADYDVPVQDRPGRAKDAEITYEKPSGPLAGEGSWETREPTEDATGVTSPIGDEHNDPTGDRGADTYQESKEIAAEHGGTMKDFGDPPIEIAGEGAEPPGVEPDPPVVDDEETGDEEAPPPAKSALKAEWIEYALANYETDLESLNAMTKDEIIETYGN